MINSNSSKYFLRVIDRLVGDLPIQEISGILRLTGKIIRTRSPAVAVFDEDNLFETLKKARKDFIKSDMVAIMTLHHEQSAPSINELADLTDFCESLTAKLHTDHTPDIRWVVCSSPVCVPHQMITIIASHKLTIS